MLPYTSTKNSQISSLRERALNPLPLGAIRPTGWLRDQLQVQADGLTGHLDEFWPSVADSRWIGGQHEGWERGPYWLDGLAPLAVLVQDERLLRKARHWVDYILEHQHPDGWFGPKDDPHAGVGEVTLDPWPHFILFKAFTQWQEATGDARIIPAMLKSARCLLNLLKEKPLRSWARMRWADLAVSLHWLYEHTGEGWLLDLAALAHQQGYDWRQHFDHFAYRERTDPAHLSSLSEEERLPLHGVNNSMGVKACGVWSRQSDDPTESNSILRGVAVLEEFHGQVTGMFSGDEHLAGRDPIQGTETCTVTEYLYTLEQLLAITGKPELADRIERIAYNALPASMTTDMWARQYDQQPNQVLCDTQRRQWVSNGPNSNLFSLEGNFGCCTANLHQGWPKFAASLWMRTGGGEEGLAATAYAPCRVSATVNGVPVTIEEQTEYPFQDEIRFIVGTGEPVQFTLALRIPAWAEDAAITINGHDPENVSPREFQRIRRIWEDGDTVVLRLPMPLRYETRSPKSVSVLRGPLVMALRIGEAWRQVGGEKPHADWAVHPTTPWNYALVLGEGAEGIAVFHAPRSHQPFDPNHAPARVTAPARRLPDWELKDGSAALPNVVHPGDSPVETVELIPYGSARLRISEFPVTAVPNDTDTAPPGIADAH